MLALFEFIEQSLVKLEGWEKEVIIISCDMRCWDAPEKADVLVGEMFLCKFIRM